MNVLIGTPAEMETARRAIAAALGYPRRGQVYRAGEHVTGDLRFDSGYVTAGLIEIEESTDRAVAVLDIPTEIEARLPPALRTALKPERDLPKVIADQREARKSADPDAQKKIRQTVTR